MTDSPSRVQVDVSDAGDRFEARTADGTVAGFAAYERTDDAVVFTHTVVEPQFEGKGVGSALVAAALAAVRESGERVVPQCSFVRAYLDRHPDQQDLTTR